MSAMTIGPGSTEGSDLGARWPGTPGAAAGGHAEAWPGPGGPEGGPGAGFDEAVLAVVGETLCPSGSRGPAVQAKTDRLRASARASAARPRDPRLRRGRRDVPTTPPLPVRATRAR
ncbi:hypothetical protein GCM10009790_35110 [Georgenia ruanii]